MDIYEFWHAVLIATAAFHAIQGGDAFLHRRGRRSAYVWSFLAVCLAMASYNIWLSLAWIGVFSENYIFQPIAHLLGMAAVLAYFILLEFHIRAPKIFKLAKFLYGTILVILATDIIIWSFTGEMFLMTKEIIPNNNLFFDHMRADKPTAGGQILFALEALSLLVIQSFLLLRLIREKSGETLLIAGLTFSVLFAFNDISIGIFAPPFLVPLFGFSLIPEICRFSLEIRSRQSERIQSLSHQVDRLERIATLGFSNAALSHDLANMFLVLSANASLIECKSQTDERRKEKMLRYIDHSVGLLKTYRAIAAGNGHKQADWYHLAEQIKNATEVVQSIHPQAEVDVRCDLEAVEVNGHSTDMLVLLYNLTKNAFDHLGGIRDKGAHWVRLSGEFQESGGYILRVSNGGAAWRPLNPDLVFSLNHSTKEGLGGSGLGLKIVGTIAKNCGFDVCLDAADPYTCFRLQLAKQSVRRPAETPNSEIA